MKRGNISRKKHCLFLLCKKYNAIYESVISYNNKILKVTNMISPEGITLKSDVYDSVIDGIERIHNKDIDYLKYDLKDYDDELPVLRDIPWYEKALNAVGGTAVSLIRDNVEGLCFIPYAIVDGMFGTNLNERLQNCLDDAEEYLINNVVTDKQFYYYGKTVGNTICMVEGAVFIANGLTTIVGGITLLGGGVALSSTGIGAIVGGPAIAVSIPVVAAGAIAISSGGGIMYSSMNNFEENLSKAQGAKTSKVDDVKMKDDIKELDRKIKVPTVKSGKFNEWFNSLSVDELDSMWQNKSIRRAIERQLRAPGGMHEWHLVSRAPEFKNWGVNAEQTRDLRTAISDVEFINPVGKHGQLGSTTAHNELLGIIDSSVDYDMFIRRLNNWANYRLKGGVDALPEGLRLK